MTGLGDRDVVIGETTYRARLSVRALATLQEHWGLASLDEVGARLAAIERFGAGDYAAVLWASLRSHHREVTYDQALGMCDELGLEETIRLISRLFDGGMPAAAADAAREAPGADPLPSPSTG